MTQSIIRAAYVRAGAGQRGGMGEFLACFSMQFFQLERDNKMEWDYFRPAFLSMELHKQFFNFFSLLLKIDKNTPLNSIV